MIDLTDFALSDATGIADLLAARGEGSFKIDESRSAIYTPKTKSFPDNTEIDATLTFVGKSKGRILGTVAPNADVITVHGHHSFIRPPDDGYQPLPYDARAATFTLARQPSFMTTRAQSMRPSNQPLRAGTD